MRYLFIIIISCLIVSEIKAENFKIIFWNGENLFDYKKDSVKNDSDFLPDSPRRWSRYKYHKKLNNICKAVIACGKGDIPAVMAFCEVENDSVIHNFLHYTPLYKLNYRFYITSSPDLRGIDIAFIYKRDRFKPISFKEININLDKHDRKTRNILLVSGLITKKDTIDIAVCHFPSRSEGLNETKKYREIANKRLRAVIDSVITVRKNPNIIVMGDFNDYPSDKNICHILNAVSAERSNKKNDDALINLMWEAKASYEDGIITNGTHKYDGEWGFLDQFIVNNSLYNRKSPPSISGVEYFNADFLLTEDTKYFGYRTKRTYYGYRYEEGFSDHLPIILDLKIR